MKDSRPGNGAKLVNGNTSNTASDIDFLFKALYTIQTAITKAIIVAALIKYRPKVIKEPALRKLLKGLSKIVNRIPY